MVNPSYIGTVAPPLLVLPVQSSADLGMKSPTAASPQRARPPADHNPSTDYPDLHNNLGSPPPMNNKGPVGQQDYPEIKGPAAGAPNFQPMSNHLASGAVPPLNPNSPPPGPTQYRSVQSLSIDHP